MGSFLPERVIQRGYPAVHWSWDMLLHREEVGLPINVSARWLYALELYLYIANKAKARYACGIVAITAIIAMAVC